MRTQTLRGRSRPRSRCVLCSATLALLAGAALSTPAFAQGAMVRATDGPASAGRPIRMPNNPDLNPNGKRLVFDWEGDIWTANANGGNARRLTWHPGYDRSPKFSPDGKWVAFLSDRSGSTQVHLMRPQGGASEQVTFDSDSKTLVGWTGDGEHLLLLQGNDEHYHYSSGTSLYSVPVDGGGPRKRVFDAPCRAAALSPDGKQAVFTMGRSSWWRKGYIGPMAEQLWHADLSGEAPVYTRLDKDRPGFQNFSNREPVFVDNNTVLYLADPKGCFEVFRMNLKTKKAEQLTDMMGLGTDDGGAMLEVSGDGKRAVFRRLFDLHTVDLAKKALSGAVPLRVTGDEVASMVERITADRATDGAFTEDGKQMAMVVADDIYLMDRVLQEPVRLTDTPNQEDDLVFTADGKHLYFTSDADGEMDIWRATVQREDGIWWLDQDYTVERLTDDRAVERNLELSPTGKHIAYLRDNHLWVMDADGSDHRVVVETWSGPSFDWSPDGKWITYSTQDDNYNADVYVVKLDGTVGPVNLSQHPDRDGSPVWSGDGSRIAWVGRRGDGVGQDNEYDIHVVTLQKGIEEATARDRKLKKALEAMAKKGKGAKDAPKPGAEVMAAMAGKVEVDGLGDKKEVTVDFEDIQERVRRIRIPSSFEGGLLFSPDGKSLMFQASIDGKRGVYKIGFPDDLRPKLVSTSSVSGARFVANGKLVVGFAGGRPATADPKSLKTTTYSFRIRTERDWAGRRQLAFDQGWRAMRDRYYDPSMNNRDWDAVRAKYRPVAAQLLGRREFSQLCNLMLGELNASHMGHSGGGDPLPSMDRDGMWTPRTMHLGVRFDEGFAGPGLKVDEVIPGSPADKDRSRIQPGEIITAVDGQSIGPDSGWRRMMTMEDARDLELTIKTPAGEERMVMIRPISSVRGLLYDEFVENNRKAVAEMSGGKLGYLHIQGMNMGSFRRFEEELYAAGNGKEGIVIDVRFNGGGSTTDHVMTALTQPRHAITVSRGSGEGYPQDRKVYASWHKPIVLMCNQYSFSNAEILAHAVKHVDRGPVVGMRTAGGVISTGSQTLADGSRVRMPGRGWYLLADGQDMELNGAMPHHAMWNPPVGPDVQLQKAVSVLQKEVAAAPEDPDLTQRAERNR